MNIKKLKKSFTLLELLLASVIIASVLSVLLLEFITCAYLSESSRNLTRGITHAQYIMEEIKNTSFLTIADQIDANAWDFDAAGFGAELCGVDADCITANILNSEVINTTVDETDPELIEITVDVSWQDKSTRASSTSLETLIAEP